MWILYASMAGIGLLISILISRQQLSIEHVEVKTGLKDANDCTPTANELVPVTPQSA
jgi:hypothetical protein